jgi:hypothetical protein
LTNIFIYGIFLITVKKHITCLPISRLKIERIKMSLPTEFKNRVIPQLMNAIGANSKEYDRAVEILDTVHIVSFAINEARVLKEVSDNIRKESTKVQHLVMVVLGLILHATDDIRTDFYTDVKKKIVH